MPDLYTLFAKISSLPKGRIAQIEDLVDVLALRRSKAPKLPLTMEQQFRRIDNAKPNRRRSFTRLKITDD